MPLSELLNLLNFPISSEVLSTSWGDLHLWKSGKNFCKCLAVWSRSTHFCVHVASKRNHCGKRLPWPSAETKLLISLQLHQIMEISLEIKAYIWKSPSFGDTYRIPYQHELQMNYLDHRHRRALLHPSAWHPVMGPTALLLPTQSLLGVNGKASRLGSLRDSFNHSRMWFASQCCPASVLGRPWFWFLTAFLCTPHSPSL